MKFASAINLVPVSFKWSCNFPRAVSVTVSDTSEVLYVILSHAVKLSTSLAPCLYKLRNQRQVSEQETNALSFGTFTELQSGLGWKNL